MSDFAVGVASLPLLLLLMFLRVPVAAAMFAVGLGGTAWLAGDMRMVDSQMKTFAFGTLTNYSFSVIPMFLLMSEFAVRGGLSRGLFEAAAAWVGHRRGGMAMAAVGASAGFGAICGSSLATASAMGRVAYPELRRVGCSGALATGTLAAGGTLGILIPPSIVLVIYALLAEENIEKLFVAALVPGLLAVGGYVATIALLARRGAAGGAGGAALPWRRRWRATRAAAPVAAVFAAVLGGIYSGAFSPTAAAAVGAAGTGWIAYRRGALPWAALRDSVLGAGRTAAMIFVVILAAGAYNSFLAAATVPQTLAAYLGAAEANPWLVLAAMLLLYFVLGMVMDSLAMILLTVPIFVPIVAGLEFGVPAAEVGIWFGILVLSAVEVGLITPPVGLNLFVINALARGVGIGETYRGVLPFVAADVVRIGVLAAFPGIVLALV